MPETLKEWKVAITSVGQGYESTKGRHDYKTGTGTTYGGRGQPMTISKTGSLSASIATSTDTWQRNANWKRRNEKHEHVLNATRRGILPKTARGSR